MKVLFRGALLHLDDVDLRRGGLIQYGHKLGAIGRSSAYRVDEPQGQRFKEGKQPLSEWTLHKLAEGEKGSVSTSSWACCGARHKVRIAVIRRNVGDHPLFSRPQACVPSVQSGRTDVCEIRVEEIPDFSDNVGLRYPAYSPPLDLFDDGQDTEFILLPESRISGDYCEAGVRKSLL